jgi:hypothetical protein
MLLFGNKTIDVSLSEMLLFGNKTINVSLQWLQQICTSALSGPVGEVTFSKTIQYFVCSMSGSSPAVLQVY